jgi:hypothetical protein
VQVELVFGIRSGRSWRRGLEVLLEGLGVAHVHPVLPNAPPYIRRARIVEEPIEDPMAKILADRVSAATIAPRVHREVFPRERWRVLEVGDDPNLFAEVLGVDEAMGTPAYTRNPFVVRWMIPIVLYAGSPSLSKPFLRTILSAILCAISSIWPRSDRGSAQCHRSRLLG